MITIISATNRPQNGTLKVAAAYYKLLKDKDPNALFFNLEELPETLNIHTLYNRGNNQLTPFAEKYINNAQKLVIVVPEYNGSYTGIFKLFLDSLPKNAFSGKTVALVGTANGRAGNLRGLDHLTNIFHYLEADVLWYKVPVSTLHILTNGNPEFTHEPTLQAFEKQIVLLSPTP